MKILKLSRIDLTHRAGLTLRKKESRVCGAVEKQLLERERKLERLFGIHGCQRSHSQV